MRGRDLPSLRSIPQNESSSGVVRNRIGILAGHRGPSKPVKIGVLVVYFRGRAVSCESWERRTRKLPAESSSQKSSSFHQPQVTQHLSK